jgi:hypothetical protein
VSIVDGIIEPLKRVAVASVPEKATHARAFMEIVEERSYIDALRLLFRGKVDPSKSFFPKRHKGAAEVRKLFEKTRSKRP